MASARCGLKAKPSAISRMEGFTLLEIMVALAIFATLATAVLSASQYVLKQAGAAEERLFAAWVADTQLNELRLESRLVIGQSQWMVHMDRRDWVVRHHVRAAGDAGLFADVEVGLAGRDHALHRAVGWIPLRHE